MGKLKDFVPKANDVMDNPGSWLAGPLTPNRGESFAHTVVSYGRGEQSKDKARSREKLAYDLSHPAPTTPSRSETAISGARAAATRRRSGRINTVLTDLDTLG